MQSFKIHSGRNRARSIVHCLVPEYTPYYIDSIINLKTSQDQIKGSDRNINVQINYTKLIQKHQVQARYKSLSKCLV